MLMSEDSIVASPRLGVVEEAGQNDDRFQKHPCGACRGLVFAMLFNLLVIFCGAVVFWLAQIL